MRPGPYQRRREAGLALVEACEQALGVRGPTALAALTGRSKSWWSKLASGAAAFPTWSELVGLLPAGLTGQERENLHLRYRKVWLALHDPELAERLSNRALVQPTLTELHALLDAGRDLGSRHGEHRTALRLQTVLEMLLISRGLEALSLEELEILLWCLDDQASCESELGNHASAITIARRAVQYQRIAGSKLGELAARHTVGLALKKAGSPALALEEFEALQREYQRLGAGRDWVTCCRDAAVTRIHMGRWAEGEAELIRAYEMPRQSATEQFENIRWLADTALRQGNVPQGRRWLAKLRGLTRRYPEETARLMARQYVSRDVANLERAVAALRPEPKG
jgi:tetratricopeptide (TPR) repeat protein